MIITFGENNIFAILIIISFRTMFCLFEELHCNLSIKFHNIYKKLRKQIHQVRYLKRSIILLINFYFPYIFPFMSIITWLNHKKSTLSSMKNARQATPLRPKVTISSLPAENLSETRPKIGRRTDALANVHTVYYKYLSHDSSPVRSVS